MIRPAGVARRALLGLAVAGLIAPRLAKAADATEITAPIQALDEALIRVMKAGKRTPFRDRFHMLAPVVDRAFDLPGILRVSVGPQWASIDPTQQTTLLKVFRSFTVASYCANFDSYDGQTITIASAVRPIGANQVVGTTVASGNGEKDRIDYVMHQDGAAWKIVDVLLDGTISRVAVQRSDFRALLAQGGPAALIVSLQAKVADLAGGALES